MVINLVIHGRALFEVWLRPVCFPSLFVLVCYYPVPPTASQHMLVSWQLFYVLWLIVNLSDLSLERELLRRKACIPQIQVPSVPLGERWLKSTYSESMW